jgi:hypothetical protein
MGISCRDDEMEIGVPAGGLELVVRHNKFAACIGFGRHNAFDLGLPAWS